MIMSSTPETIPATVGGPPRWIYFILFALSGFSGLIYESIWSHYLKLFLGHAAYAQALVLIIFMGGLALGSWLAAQLSGRWRRPIMVYAVVEAIIGVLALVFHPTFVGLTDAFFDALLPAVGGSAGNVLKWVAAALLISPQCVLLGMTFPLLTGGVLRRYPGQPGHSLSLLYFTNSLGGALGVLASGFWLIGAVGLPGTIAVAGALNIALALLVFLLVRSDPGRDHVAAMPAAPAGQAPGAGLSLAPLFLMAAALTGTASFLYEVGWIRMLSLVLGSTTHSFELMLSAFIGGLALGGLWIRKRLETHPDPLALAGRVQLVMAVLAVASIVVYVQSFSWMEAVLPRLPLTDRGFLAFTLLSHGIAVAVMLPAAFAAGMTLPLFTFVLLRQGVGEKAIGQVYAANTIGSIAGVLLAVHVGLPYLGLKGTVGAGALLDAILGVVLLHRAGKITGVPAGRALQVGAAVLVVVISGLAIMPVDPRTTVSGVYRYGRAALPDYATVEFYRDGKTATVAVIDWGEGSRTISTNGKPDATLQMNRLAKAALDEQTMVLAGALPGAYHPTMKRAAVIGFGSGLTTHTMLAEPGLEVVDTIEIEPAMVEAARLFDYRVRRAYEDPRSQIRIEDAKTFFPLGGSRYDVIIAEPSNPWVSGVASLFSSEFYTLANRYLEDDGLFVQWVQLYEFNDQLAVSVLKALAPHFDDFALYTHDFDGIIVARKRGQLGKPDYDRVMAVQGVESMARVGLPTPASIGWQLKAPRSRLLPLLDRYPEVPANSDYYPYVDLNAPIARFKQTTADTFVVGAGLF
jgi:spermidine synthase